MNPITLKEKELLNLRQKGLQQPSQSSPKNAASDVPLGLKLVVWVAAPPLAALLLYLLLRLLSAASDWLHQ